MTRAVAPLRRRRFPVVLNCMDVAGSVRLGSRSVPGESLTPIGGGHEPWIGSGR